MLDRIVLRIHNVSKMPYWRIRGIVYEEYRKYLSEGRLINQKPFSETGKSVGVLPSRKDGH